MRKRTPANLSCLPAEVIEGLKVLLRGGVAMPIAQRPAPRSGLSQKTENK
jgi:hypothetical protein